MALIEGQSLAASIRKPNRRSAAGRGSRAEAGPGPRRGTLRPHHPPRPETFQRDDGAKRRAVADGFRAGRPTESEIHLTDSSTLPGTLPFMAPEQFDGEAANVRSDLYSLGVVMYQLLTGRLPFPADVPPAQSGWKNILNSAGLGRGKSAQISIRAWRPSVCGRSPRIRPIATNLPQKWPTP